MSAKVVLGLVLALAKRVPLARLAEVFFDNIRRFERGEPPRNQGDRARGYRASRRGR